MTEKVGTVVITGFGPFEDFKVNASWEAVKVLMAMPEVNDLPVRLVATEIPVSYDDVLQKVPELYARENPILMIHVGVSSGAHNLMIEKFAYKEGYGRNDIEGKVPDGQCCAVGSEPCLPTAFDVDALVKKFNEADFGVSARTSKAAGRYLCEFIFYRSLHENKRRSLFIHVPNLDDPYSVKELGEGLYHVIRLALEELPKIELADRMRTAEQKGALAS